MQLEPVLGLETLWALIAEEEELLVRRLLLGEAGPQVGLLVVVVGLVVGQDLPADLAHPGSREGFIQLGRLVHILFPKDNWSE